jgi:hypothetical protein
MHKITPPLPPNGTFPRKGGIGSGKDCLPPRGPFAEQEGRFPRGGTNERGLDHPSPLRGLVRRHS